MTRQDPSLPPEPLPRDEQYYERLEHGFLTLCEQCSEHDEDYVDAELSARYVELLWRLTTEDSEKMEPSFRRKARNYITGKIAIICKGLLLKLADENHTKLLHVTPGDPRTLS